MRNYPDASVESLVNRLKTALDEGESVKFLESELADARNEIQRLLKHSHQVQESLEEVFHDDQAKRREIEKMQNELSELRNQHQDDVLQRVKAFEENHTKVIEQLSNEHAKTIEQLLNEHAKTIEQLSKEHSTIKLQLSEKSAELNLALEQLEHYFLQSRQKSIIIEKYEELHEKSMTMIQSKCIE